MKNKNGFTLVELLVAIVIMGIITAIAIPMIRNIREGNEDKQYQTYSESLKHAAKLYLSSYEEDLFGREESGCAIISYQQLKNRDLIKDIPIDKTTCEGTDTFVKVVKIDGKYGYSTSIVCGERVDGTLKETYKYPKEGIPSADICSVQSDIIMGISANPASSNSNKYKRRSIKLKIMSDTGIDNNAQLSYGFSTDKNINIMNSWDLVTLTVPGKDNQKNKILDGNIIEVTSNKIYTPENISGEYYLVVRVDKLQDLAGKEWKKEDSVEGEGNFLYFGPYLLDNIPPELNASTIISSESTFNSTTPKLNFAATDNLSSEDDMKMCISYDADTCSKTTEDIKANNGYEKYNKSKVLPQISNANNGTVHKIYVTIADAAGNYTTQEYDYKVDLLYQLSYALDRGSYGTNHPTEAKGDQQITINNPSKAVKITLSVASGISVDYTGSTISASGQSVAYTFNGWDITNMTNSPHIYGTTTVTETSSTGRKETTYKNLRNSPGTVTLTAKWTSPLVTLPKITKTGHTCVWQSSGINDRASGATYKPDNAGGATARTFTAKCTANTYTIKYHKNSTAATGSISDTTCTYGQNCTIAASTFNREGYHVTKYTTNSNGTGTVYNSNGATVSNLTTENGGTINLYANWAANTYTIKYHKNSTDATGSISNTTCTYGQNCTIAASTFKREGYHVTKYTTNSNGTGTVYNSNGATVSNLTTENEGTINLYANWIVNYLYFYLNGNGGTWCGTNPSKYRLSTNSSYPASSGYIEHTRDDNGTTVWDNRWRYPYNYVIGTHAANDPNNPGIGFPDHDAPNVVCFSKKDHHAVAKKQWTDKKGHYLDEDYYGYNTKDMYSTWTPGCDLRWQDCSVTVYVNWVHD